jgi:hypothetical protein
MFVVQVAEEIHETSVGFRRDPCWSNDVASPLVVAAVCPPSLSAQPLFLLVVFLFLLFFNDLCNFPRILLVISH